MNITIKSLTFTLFVSQCVLSNAWSTDHNALFCDDIAPSLNGRATEVIYCAQDLPTEVIDIINKKLTVLDGSYQYDNGILQYTPKDGGQKVLLRFSDFKDETFDLSGCGNVWPGGHVITQSMKDFFIVEGKNKDKLVTLVVLRHDVEQAVKQAIKEDKKHPFAEILKSWPEDKPVGLFWRYGNNKNPARFDYLTTSTLEEISQRNLFENWEKTDGEAREVPQWGWERSAAEYSFIFKPK